MTAAEITAAELARRLDENKAAVSSLSESVASLAASVAQLTTTTAVLANEIQRGHAERTELKGDVKEISRALADRNGLDRAVKWLVGVGATVLGAIGGAWAAGLFGRGG